MILTSNKISNVLSFYKCRRFHNEFALSAKRFIESSEPAAGSWAIRSGGEVIFAEDAEVCSGDCADMNDTAGDSFDERLNFRSERFVCSLG
jgi:hypothetical protein